LFKIFPELVQFGRLRAKKAYENLNDTITKPSYIGRLRHYGSQGIDQIENTVSIASKEPASGGLCFNIFEPEDLIKRLRPGYVPCLISGTFIVHDGEFQLTAFFRSQSIIEFAIYDLIYLRKLQISTLSSLVECGAIPRTVGIGSLNMFMARVFCASPES
jgi:thymidylate synthase